MTSCLYERRLAVDRSAIKLYGYKEEQFRDLMRESVSLKNFCREFSYNFFKYRHKDTNSIWIEKTPQNIGCISEFLNTFKEGYFIFLIRNPIYVYRSLRERGMSRFMALYSWLIDAAGFFPLRNNPRAICIKYEDLVADPFGKVSGILNDISNGLLNISPDKIEKYYYENDYRKRVKRHSTWSFSDFGRMGNANIGKLNKKTVEEFASSKDAKVSTPYAKIFDLYELGVIEALDYFGYSDTIELIKNNEPDKVSKNMIGSYDKIALFGKWYNDHIYSDSALSQIKSYTNPIINESHR